MMHYDTKVAPELDELHLPDKPDGPAAAVMLSAGIGIFVLGLMTLLNEMSEGINKFLLSFEMGRGVGPLAGKTILGALAFFVSWLVLGLAWRKRNIDIKRMFWVGLVLGVLGAVLMFPPVFEAFAA